MAAELETLGGALELARGKLARSEARLLLQLATGHAANYLVAHPEVALLSTDLSKFRKLLARRAAGEPMAYLLGWREFYARRFHVTPDVLIPRPETELIVDIARELHTAPPARVLDLGTGSGVLAVTLALQWPGVEVVAVDRSDSALAVARGNAETLGAQVTFLRSDWFGALHGADFFSLIVANPPYVARDDAHLTQGDVRFEPHGALASGPNGLDDIRRIVRDAPSHLASGGWLLVEHGYDQAVVVRDLMRCAGFPAPRSWCDLAGIERVSGAARLDDVRAPA